MTQIEETNIDETVPESESPADQPAGDADNLWQDFELDAQEYKNKTPDFTEAFSYLLARRDAQLAAYGAIDKRLSDPAARAHHIENEAFQVLSQAAKAGVSPAEFIYNMAKAQGYGQAANVAADYEQKNKTRSAAKSLTLSAGGAGSAPMNIESLAALPQEEFDSWYWQNKDEFKRIMGR